jgi:hypothetical protein
VVRLPVRTGGNFSSPNRGPPPSPTWRLTWGPPYLAPSAGTPLEREREREEKSGEDTAAPPLRRPRRVVIDQGPGRSAAPSTTSRLRSLHQRRPPPRPCGAPLPPWVRPGLRHGSAGGSHPCSRPWPRHGSTPARAPRTAGHPCSAGGSCPCSMAEGALTAPALALAQPGSRAGPAQ